MLLVACLATAGLALSAQRTDSTDTQQPFSHYEGSQSTIRVAKVTWSSLGEHRLVSTPELMFLLPRDITLEYDFTISEEGRVIYVKPKPCQSTYLEFQKGGISALYGTRFTPTAKGSGSQKAKASFTFSAPEKPIEPDAPLPAPKPLEKN
jgi:hypothetical protein